MTTQHIRTAIPGNSQPAMAPAALTAPRDRSRQQPTMRQAFVATVDRLMSADDRIILVLADISTDAFADTTRQHPGRVINVGIREQLMVGVAGGLALEERRPVVHSYAPFLVERAFEQVKLDLSHQGVGAVLVSVGASYDEPGYGRTHQAPGDIALLKTLPDISLHVPGHPGEVAALLSHAVAAAGTHYVRLSVRCNDFPLRTPPGEITVVRHGRAAGRGVVLAVGPMLRNVLEATEQLDVSVGYLSTVRPFPVEALRSILPAGPVPMVAVVEPYLAGTSAHEISTALTHLPHRLLSLGVQPVELRRYGTPDQHDRAHGLHPAALHAQLAEFLG